VFGHEREYPFLDAREASDIVEEGSRDGDADLGVCGRPPITPFEDGSLHLAHIVEQSGQEEDDTIFARDPLSIGNLGSRITDQKCVRVGTPLRVVNGRLGKPDQLP
jgi:hypothetical protein